MPHSAADRRVLHQLQLDLLDFGQPLPLPGEDVIDFFVQVPDFELNFEIDPVIVFRPQAVLRFLALLTHHDGWRLNGGQT